MDGPLDSDLDDSGDSLEAPPPADLPEAPEAPPPADSLEALPPEAVTLALAWVGPRSVKRFGATCRAYRALADWYVTRAEYGLLLVQSARLRLKNDLARQHADCCKASAGDFDARAARHASRVAAALAGAGEAPPRTKLEILRFLYPMALLAHEDWVLAPYALEWCALAERRVLTGDPRAPPRRELLALLHDDAFARLAELAREAGWPLGVTAVATAAAACATLAAGAACAPLVRQVVRLLAREAKKDAALHGNHEWSVLCVAVEAVTDLHLAGGKRPSGSWQYVKKRGAVWTRRLQALELPASLDARWRALVGLEGGDRSPRAWLAKFECGPFEPHGALPADEALLRFAGQAARGEAPVVPVPNPALADLLGRAAEQAPESDAEDEDSLLAELLLEAARGPPAAAGEAGPGPPPAAE